MVMRNFFHYYGYVFDYDQNIICPFVGRPIRKTDFDLENIEKLSDEFIKLKNYYKSIDLLKADKICDLFANNSAFVVQDPFELNHNVTKYFSKVKTLVFKELCRQSYDVLNNREILKVKSSV